MIDDAGATSAAGTKPAAQTLLACQHSEAIGQRWGDEIPAARLDALLKRLHQSEAESDRTDGHGPFEGMHLTGADVFWLRVATVVGPDGDLAGAANELLTSGETVTMHLPEPVVLHLERADLRSAHLEGANLRGARLQRADLRDAHLEGADLRE